MSPVQRFLRLLVPIVLLPVAAATALITTQSSPVSALCAASPLAGVWHNVDANTRSITHVDIRQNCDDQVLCDQNGHCTGGSGSAFTIATFGKCSPTDCAWGTRPAVDAGGGWLTATYSFGFKTSSVWVKTYPFYGRTYMRVWVNNHFSPADGRADYTSDEWFLT